MDNVSVFFLFNFGSTQAVLTMTVNCICLQYKIKYENQCKLLRMKRQGPKLTGPGCLALAALIKLRMPTGVMVL